MANAINYNCPKCGAQPTRHCVTKGFNRTTFHKSRKIRAGALESDGRAVKMTLTDQLLMIKLRLTRIELYIGIDQSKSSAL